MKFTLRTNATRNREASNAAAAAAIAQSGSGPAETVPAGLRTGDIKLHALFAIMKSLRAQVSPDDFPRITATRAYGSLTHDVAGFADAEGFVLQHQLRGSRGYLRFYARRVERAEAPLETGVYAYDATGARHVLTNVDTRSDELARLQFVDDVFAAQLVSLYNRLMPKKPLPSYAVLTSALTFRDWSAADDDAHRMKRVGPGLYPLVLSEPTPRQSSQWLRLVVEGVEGSLGDTPAKLEELEDAHDGTLTLVRIRTHFCWYPDSLEGRTAESEGRESHDGLPFKVLTVHTGEDGRPEYYRVAFDDGFEATAADFEVEYLD
jgi:hypothetical protein